MTQFTALLGFVVMNTLPQVESCTVLNIDKINTEKKRPSAIEAKK
jgi:hypothetical protein